jgi:hypothetical protein
VPKLLVAVALFVEKVAAILARIELQRVPENLIDIV